MMGKHSNNSFFMAMDLLGPSLGDLFLFCGNRFSLKTTLMLGLQMLERLEVMHAISIIHRDIKPCNILMGINDSSNILHLVDLGLGKRMVSSDTKEHIEYTTGNQMVGTAYYASINAHLGNEQSRRDDLEGLGYVLIQFLQGTLPWHDIEYSSKKEKEEKIKDLKLSLSFTDLTKDCPEEILKLMKYSRELGFKKAPDFTYLKTLMTSLADKNRIDLHDK